MKRLFKTLVCLSLAASFTGCTLCYTPYDDHYNAFGGVVERHDRQHGRVGSVLSDPSAQFTDSAGEAATEDDLYRLESDQLHLEPIEAQPTPADVDI